MTLTLLVIRCPDEIVPEKRTLSGGEFSIGRGPDNDWVLADPDRHLSKRHCELAYRDGEWLLTDTSANGTFLNQSSSALGRERSRPVEDGDRIRIGAYEIEISIGRRQDERATFQPATASARPHSLDPFAEDWPAPRTAASRDDEPFGRSDLDPFAEDDFPRTAPVHADRAPAIDEAFRPPRPLHAIPDDWDQDDLAFQPAPSNPAAARPNPPPPAARSPTVPLDDAGDDPFAIEPPLAAAPLAPPPPVRPAPPAPAQPEPGVAGAADPDALVAAFLRGAGLDDIALPDPERSFEALGAAFRATVAGIRETMIARAAVKGEFRIEQTMIRSSGNNPLKFSAGDDDALGAFIGTGRRNVMPPARAIEEALRDMRLHELATMGAMQQAVRSLVAGLDPQAIEAQSERGHLAVLPAQKKARAWDAFADSHRKISQALSDDFDSVFGRAFARAYETILHELEQGARR